MKNITVYCGSADRVNHDYLTAARDVGRYLAAQGIRLVYGGGKTGLMGAVAEGALEAGGEVIGVIVESMNTPALAQTGLTRLEVTPSMHERKARLYELSDAFIALPGGFGTFDELFETVTWGQIGLHEKPVGLLNTRNYYAPLMAALRHAVQEGFVFEEHLKAISLADTAPELLERLRQHEHPRAAVKRWMREE